MLGLIGTLELSKRGMNTNRQGIELTGHNLSNVSNPAYARQRLKIQTGDTLPGPNGPTGTGSKVTQIEQVRSALLDSQVTTETSVAGFLEAKQKALEFGEVNLGQQLDRQASTPEGASATIGIGGQFGVIEGLSEFFASLQALSTNPNSTADRQVVLLKAHNLTEKFTGVSERLARLRADLNSSVEEDVTVANGLIAEIADLSKGIAASELSSGNANDLRDRRQQKLEALSKIATIQTATVGRNEFQLSVGGVTVISGNAVADRLQTFTDANGATQVRSVGGSSVTLTSGSMQGTMDARDGAIATLDSRIDTLAATLIEKVNELHEPGFALDGTSTGQAFFTGTDASNIKVNTVLKADPSRIQASANGDSGNNEVALAMAQLAQSTHSDLGNLTFTENFNQTVANFGQELANTRSQLLDEKAVLRMLERQRDSIGGVSIDEEMTNLVIFQRAFQASAKMVNTIDDLLQSVINLAR